jgi:hypothetical protein
MRRLVGARIRVVRASVLQGTGGLEGLLPTIRQRPQRVDSALRILTPIVLAVVIASCSPARRSTEPSGSSVGPSHQAAEDCVSIGTDFAQEIDWGPTGKTLSAIVGRADQSSFSVLRIDYPSLANETLDQSPLVVAFATAVDERGSVYWQRSRNGGTDLVRKTLTDTTVWPISEDGFSAIDASASTMYVTQVVAIGTEANAVELLTLRVDDGTQPRTKLIETVVGLEAIALSSAGDAVAFAAHPSIGGPTTFSVSGQHPWSITISDASPPMALDRTDSAILYVEPSTSALRRVTRDGTKDAPFGNTPVLAFDLSSNGVMAWSTPNVTGGPGRICFAWATS